MSDNPRVALYGAKYTVALANRHSLGPDATVTVAGRHCEAGDEIARDVELPADIHPGDLLAVACTGAYHHSMASNYNMVGRPPLVAVRRGESLNSCAARRPRTCSRATADGQAASPFTTSTPVGSTPTVTDAPGENTRAAELAIPKPPQGPRCSGRRTPRRTPSPGWRIGPRVRPAARGCRGARRVTGPGLGPNAHLPWYGR